MTTYPAALLVAALVATGCAYAHYHVDATAGTVSEPGAHALAIVRIHAPWYAPRFAIRSRFRDAVPEYEAIPALEAKYFTISDDRRFGGIYVWTSRAAADAYYSDAWRRGIRVRRGVEPDLVVFDAPLLVRGRTAIDGEPVGARSISYAAAATLVTWSAQDPTPTEAIADCVKGIDGLVRAAVIVAPGRVGFVAVWATRELAEAALSGDSLRARAATLGLSHAEITYFEAPVLIDASLMTTRSGAAPMLPSR